MPELGSAYFTLATASEPFVAGVEEAEVAAKDATTAIAEQFGVVDEATMQAGESAQMMAAEFDSAGAEMAAGVEAGAAGVAAASAEAAAAGEASAATFAESWGLAKSAMMGLFAGGMVIGGMEMLIGKTIEYGHSILQLSAAFHISSQEASRLQAETEMVGMQGSSVMMTISRLTKAAGDETGTTAQAMEKWGINVAKFRTAGAQEQLQMLSDAYANAGKKSTQFLSDVLGGRGMKLAPLISEFDELHSATEGIDFPAPSAEDIIKEEKFKVEMDNVIHKLQFDLVPVLVKAAPLIAAVGGAFVTWKVLSAVSGMVRALWTGTVSVIKAVWGFTASMTANMGSIVADTGAMVALTAEEGLLTVGTMEASAAFETFGAAILGPLAAALAAGLAIGTMLDHIFNIHEKLDRLIIDNSINEADSVNTEADAYAKLADGVKKGTISKDEYTAGVEDLNAKYGASIDAVAAYNMLTDTTAKQDRKAAAAAQAHADKIARLQKAITVLGFKSEHAFNQWKDNIMTNMSSAMMSVGSFQKKWTFTGHSFVKTMNQMAKKDREMVKDLVAFNKVAVPPDFKIWLESQGPDAIHGFMQANSDGQDQVVKDWKKSKGAVKAYGDQLDPITIAGGTAFDPLSNSAEGGKTAVDNLSLSIQNLHGNMDALAGTYSITVTNGSPQTGGGTSGGTNNKGGAHPGGHGPRAAGGPVMSGRSYLVGERGPEIFSPDGNGTIIANQHLSRAVGGGGGGGSVVTRLRIDDWESGLATIEVMARDAARDEAGQDGARSRMRRLS